MRDSKLPVNLSPSVVRGLFALALVALLLVSLPWIEHPFFDHPAPATTPRAKASTPARVAPEKKSAAQSASVGDDACRSCHQDKTDSYHHTAHSITSRTPSKDSISGHFGPGSNIFKSESTNLFFEMKAATNGFFQTAVLDLSSNKVARRTERFEIVIGSGRKGQTYLYWQGDNLFQLPVSYWVEGDGWVKSPGLAEGSIYFFERIITARCLECHANSFEWLPPRPNHYNRAAVTLGISCEKCHGPGREHVALFRSKSPTQPLPNPAIINPARLSRDRQMDVCALCHAGHGNSKTFPGTFVPGDVLSHHLELPKPSPDDYVDVHGSQVQLLKRSRCYQSSPAMTCSTCHDVHTPQRDVAAAAARCLTCHKVESCGTFAKAGHEIDRKCVTCHMPLQPTVNWLNGEGGKKLFAKVRNHRIGIYPNPPPP